MKDGRTHLAHKAEHAVDLDTGAIVAVTLQGADEGDTTTIVETARPRRIKPKTRRPTSRRPRRWKRSLRTRAITAIRRWWTSTPSASGRISRSPTEVDATGRSIRKRRHPCMAIVAGSTVTKAGANPNSVQRQFEAIDNWSNGQTLPQALANDMRSVLREAILARLAWFDPVIKDPDSATLRRVHPDKCSRHFDRRCRREHPEPQPGPGGAANCQDGDRIPRSGLAASRVSGSRWRSVTTTGRTRRDGHRRGTQAGHPRPCGR